MTRKDIDPVLISIFQRKFKSIAEEMALTLLRTTRSPIFNEARDFCTGLYDAEGGILEQAEYIPVLAMSNYHALKYIIKYFEGEIYPGDVIIHNDVFTQGNQLTDVAIYKPIFYRDKLVGWSCCKGHVADIGGNVPGGYNPFATEVWQEGLRISPVKIYERGRFRRDVWDFIFNNIRFSFVADDIRAEVGGCTIGERKLQELIERFGLEVYEAHVAAMYDATERLVRDQIERFPDGVYRGECSIHNDGISDGKWTTKVTITISGSNLTVDFTGTSPSAAGFINQPLGSTMSAVWIALFMFLGIRELPHNAGMLRPVKIIVPEGSLHNVAFPLPSVMGNHMTSLVGMAMSHAFAQAVPERAFAEWNREHASIATGINPKTRRPWADVNFCLLYTSPSPRDLSTSRMPSSA